MFVLRVMAVALVASLSLVAYTLAAFALLFMLGMEAAKWAYASGSGSGRIEAVPHSNATVSSS